MIHYVNTEEKNVFKGSVTVTFSTREEAEIFMSLGSVRYNDFTIRRLWS